MPSSHLLILDGSQLAETALAPAAALSLALSVPLSGALYLTRVLPIPVRDGEQDDEVIAAKREKEVSAAEAYLNTIKLRMQGGDAASKLQVTTLVTVDSDIASALLATAEDGDWMETAENFRGCDVIAMATHGRGGLERWMLGSMTERVLAATRLPLLIIRPQQPEGKHEEADKTQKSERSPRDEEEIASWVGLL